MNWMSEDGIVTNFMKSFKWSKKENEISCIIIQSW